MGDAIAHATQLLATGYLPGHDLEAARARFAELAVEGDRFTRGFALVALADASRCEDTIARALEVVDDVPVLLALARVVEARVAAAAARWDDAQRAAEQALEVIARGGYGQFHPAVLDVLAEVAWSCGRFDDAARLLAAGRRGRAERGIDRPDPPFAAAVRRTLGPRFETATPRRPSHDWESLTPAEQQVVDLAAVGLSNPEIGAQLFVSRATVKTHLVHAYAKLGVRNRAELAAAAGRRAPALAA